MREFKSACSQRSVYFLTTSQCLEKCILKLKQAGIKDVVACLRNRSDDAQDGLGVDWPDGIGSTAVPQTI
jgi:hypothetical protein